MSDGRKESSPELSTLANEVLYRTAKPRSHPPIEWLRMAARRLAASVLSQDETEGQNND